MCKSISVVNREKFIKQFDSLLKEASTKRRLSVMNKFMMDILKENKQIS